MLKIREIRKAKGLTMKQLGDMVGALESSISFYERGVQQPDLDMLRKIADALCVSTDELLDHNQDRVEEDESMIFRQQIRNNPDYRILFSAAKKAKPEHLRAAVAVLKSLEGEEDAD